MTRSIYSFAQAAREIDLVKSTEPSYVGSMAAKPPPDTDPAIAIEKVFLNEAKVLAGCNYRDGCPIASITLDSGSNKETLRTACATAFAA